MAAAPPPVNPFAQQAPEEEELDPALAPLFEGNFEFGFNTLGDEDSPDEVTEEDRESFDTFAQEAGIATTSELENDTSTLEAILRQAGVDVDHQAVQAMITQYPDILRDPALGPAAIANLAETYPAVPVQIYDQALAQSGFSGPFLAPTPPPGFSQLSAQEGLNVAKFRTGTPGFETQVDTGWIRYKNGVLVSPDGQVAFDPTSRAQGSIRWQREVVSGWSDEQVGDWRQRLQQFGYLSKDQAKVKGVDQVFLSALSNYHIARYANGGKPVADDLSGAAGAGTKPPLVDFEDLSAQIRNDVREQYRRVFGMDATDGQVVALSDYIIRTAETLQKKYRRKGYGGFTSLAATEAEERFIERIEGSPQAEFLRESEEENTSLRDALQQAVVVTNSLGG